MGRCLEEIEVIVVTSRDKKEAALEFSAVFLLAKQYFCPDFELG